MTTSQRTLIGPRRWAVGAIAAMLMGACWLASGVGSEAGTGPAATRASATRAAWTTSRLTGSPDPPLPYATRGAFPALKFDRPVDLAFTPGGAGAFADRVFVLEQGGKVYSFPNRQDVQAADLMLDLSKISGWQSVADSKGFGEAYGMAFHPDFARNRCVYIAYVLSFKSPGRNHENGSRVSRFTVGDADPPRVDVGSEKVILQWLGGGHNGGCVKFGPDGCLYVSTGDGADPDPPDPFDTGQNVGDLLSSILRIDVDHSDGERAYSIPGDNPFVKTPGARPEVYAYGLRNPWRMSFDRATGRLWAGDVGWELWESVFCIKAGTNCGWSVMEGPNPVHPNGKHGPTPITPPAAAVSHDQSASITGGVVYRGKVLPDLVGHYVFGDWQTQRLWAAKCEGTAGDALAPFQEIAQTEQRIVAFGEQPDGELLIADHAGGGLWRIVPNDQKHSPADFPRLLSQTGLFALTPDQTPQPGVIPFQINAPQWLDGASAERWIAVPGTASMSWGKGVWGDDKPAWPRDSVLARTIRLEGKPGDAASRRKVETQVLHFDGRQWRGYTYAWNEAQTDAELVDAAGDSRAIALPDPSAPEGVRRQAWHFPSRAQCMTCHNVWCDYTLAFTEPQLDRPQVIGGETENGITAFRRLGLLLAPKGQRDGGGERQVLSNPYDPSADLNERARSYLHVNCSHCHRFGGGGSAVFDVRKELPREKLGLIDARPALGAFGIDGARLISPGRPDQSVLLYRMAKLGTGRMPRIDSDVVDAAGLNLIRQWIGAMPSPTPNPPGSGASQQEIGKALDILADPAAADAAARAGAADRLLATTGGAMTLLGALDAGKLAPAGASAAIARGMASNRDPVRDLFRRFDPAEMRGDRLGANINPARLLAMAGDAERGRKLFFEQSGAGLCARCHRVGAEGVDFGPDLTHIAAKYKRPELLDQVINPSKAITPGFTSYVIETTDGDAHTGILIDRNERELTLKDAQGQPIRIPAAQVAKARPQALSAMPDGLLADLNAQQAADLLAFLQSLK